MRSKMFVLTMGLACFVASCTKDGEGTGDLGVGAGMMGTGGAGGGGQGGGPTGGGGGMTAGVAPTTGGAGGMTGGVGGMTGGVGGTTGGSGGMTGGVGGMIGTDDDAGAVGDAGTAGTGSNAGDADTGPAPCTDKPGAVRGKSRQTMMIDGLERWFNYYAPSTLDPNTPVPLVIVPHGYFMDGDIMYDVTEYADLADEEQFVVAFPSGAGPTALEPPWNIGTSNPQCVSTLGFVPFTENDDQAFVDAIIEFAAEDQCIDREHVFMTGFSMGGYFSNTTGCNNGNVKAIAPHSGGSHDFAACPETAKPVLLMHFEQDGLIPYQCGIESRDRWLALNGCDSADPELRMVNGGSCAYYNGCQAGGQVAMCTFQTPAGGDEVFAGHGWSGGYEPQPVGLSGYAIPETESATRLSWEFFKEFAW